MGILDFFTRKKPNVKDAITTNSSMNSDAIIFENYEIKEMIAEWTKKERWELNDFATFLELTGVHTPVKLSELNEKKSFKCITALNTVVTISILDGGVFSYPELWITYGEETKKYETNGNYGKCAIPEVTLKGKTIKRNGKELNSLYYRHCYHVNLKLNEINKLVINIEPHFDKKSEIFGLRNCESIEEYLLGLDNSMNVVHVYDKLIELLGFSNEDISNSEEILIDFVKKVDNRKKTISKILTQKGKIKEYAISENGETFHVFKGGDWEYWSNIGRITYSAEKKQYYFSTTGSINQLNSIRLPELLSRVELTISKMWSFVK